MVSGNSKKPNKNGLFVLFVVILTLFLGLSLRLIGLEHGFPRTIHHPDVSKQTFVANAVLHHDRYVHQRLEGLYGDRAYQYTMYPYGTAVLAGRWARMAGVQTAFDAPPEERWAWAYRLRVLAVVLCLLGTTALTLWAMFRFGPAWGLLLGLLLVTDPLSNQYSHYGMNTVPMVAMTLLAWLCCWGMGRDGWQSILCAGLAGLSLGLGIGIKYQALFAGLFVIAAWMALVVDRKWKWGLLTLGCGILGGVIGLKLTCYISNYHPAYFVEHIGEFMAWQKHVLGTDLTLSDQISQNIQWIGRFSLRTGLWLFAPGLVWASIAACRSSLPRLQRAMYGVAVLYIGLMLATLVSARELMRSNDMLSVIPFMMIVTVAACHHWFGTQRYRNVARVLGTCLAGYAAWSGIQAWQDSSALERPDTREVAAAWCRTNLQPGDRLVRERYVNGVGLEGVGEERQRYLCAERVRVPIEGGEFTHLISSSLAYGRYFDPLDPRYNEAHVAFYQGLEKHYKIVAVFEDRRLEFSNPTITVYEWRGTETDE